MNHKTKIDQMNFDKIKINEIILKIQIQLTALNSWISPGHVQVRGLLQKENCIDCYDFIELTLRTTTFELCNHESHVFIRHTPHKITKNEEGSRPHRIILLFRRGLRLASPVCILRLVEFQKIFVVASVACTHICHSRLQLAFESVDSSGFIIVETSEDMSSVLS